MEEFDPEVACKHLRDMRDEKVRDSVNIVDIGERLIRKHSHRFGDEIWLICEQVFLASLDTCRYDLADICLQKLENHFPESRRVKKLKAIQHEAVREYEEALAIYDEIEKEDPTDAAIRKRRTAIHKAKGSISGAIKSITEYLKIFMADSEAWMELADLYIEELEFSKAAFCMEEIILTQPFNHLYHQRYAEIKYSQGGLENFLLAREHYTQALYLSHNSNMRALYGLLVVSNQLLTGKGSEKDGKRKNKKYVTWAAKMIHLKYKASQEQENDEGTRTETVQESNQGELTASITELLDQMHMNST